MFRRRLLPITVAPLTVTPAGPVCLDPIGDFKQPLPLPRDGLRDSATLRFKQEM